LTVYTKGKLDITSTYTHTLIKDGKDIEYCRFYFCSMWHAWDDL